MKKSRTKKYVITPLLAALALGVTGAGISTAVRVDAAEPSQSAATEGVKQITPLLETSFDNGTVGQHYDIYNQMGEMIWDQNHTAGSIVDSFDGKAYRFTGTGAGEYCQFGGIKVNGSIAGESYTLTMKADFANCDYVIVEYVAKDDAAGMSRWGAFQLRRDGIYIHDGGNNSFVNYDAESKELSYTVTASANSEEAATGMGFFQLTAYNATEGVYLDVDDISITVADSLMNEDCESLPLGALNPNGSFNKFWNDASSLSVVEYGTDNKAVKYTANDASSEYCTFGYLNRLGFITNEETYLVSFDYELRGYQTLFIEYVPENGGAGLKVLSSGEVQADWNAGVNLKNAMVTVDPENPAKGTLSFEWKPLESKTEFKFTGKQDSVNAEGDHALILDNIVIDAVRAPISVESTAGNGSFSALTFNPRTGTNNRVTVTPDTGWHVAEIKVDGVAVDLSKDAVFNPNDSSYTYTYTEIPAASTLSATFERNVINVTVTGADGVTITKTENVLYGDEVVFNVTLEENYQITSVKLNGEDVTLTEGKYVVEYATEDLNFIVLTKKVAEYTMSYEATQDGGSVTCSADKVQQGGSVVYTITPNEGWEVKSVKYNGKNVSLVDGKYTVENVTADGKLVVEFTKISGQPQGPTTPNNPETPDNSDENDKKPSNVGMIVGIICGVIGACAIAAVVTIVLLKKKAGKSNQKVNEESKEEDENNE